MSSPAAGVCVPIFQPGRVPRAPAVRPSPLVFSPAYLHHNSRPNPSFQGGNQAVVEFQRRPRRETKESEVFIGLVFWSLIECLEDKPGDIRYPSGQRMGG